MLVMVDTYIEMLPKVGHIHSRSHRYETLQCEQGEQSSNDAIYKYEENPKVYIAFETFRWWWIRKWGPMN